MSCRTQGEISRRPEGEYIRLRRLIEVFECGFQVWRVDERILGARGRIEVLRADLRSGGLIWYLGG